MKVSELTDEKLDYWVAKAEGNEAIVIGKKCNLLHGPYLMGEYPPSSDWSQGGPIIEREGIQLVPGANGEQWAAGIDCAVQGGDTALIAAMRCYVASKFGEEVPDEPTS